VFLFGLLQVVELRKMVIWTEPERGNEDYCCVCCDGGELVCCDGMCFRSFHVECVGLPQVPEGDFVCELCSSYNPFDGQEGEEREQFGVFVLFVCFECNFAQSAILAAFRV
jgi:hypothetical protein